MKYLKIFLALLVAASLSGVAFAQVGQMAGQVEINAELIPATPKANERVDVMLTSYATNIDAATISWYVNGKLIRSGKGEKNFYFMTGDLNTATTLDIKVTTAEGAQVNNSYKIKPSEVDLMWQSESLVSPFYKGKPLFSHQNKITFIAFPHMVDDSGKEIDSKNLVYKWNINDNAMQDGSGFGKYSYTYVGDIISRPLTVTVEVTDQASQSRGFASVDVTPVEPEILMYEKNPLYGIQFQKALRGTVEMNDRKEMTILGIPFYSGTLDQTSPDITYKWSLNGASTNNQPRQNVIVFRRKEGVFGVAKISLSTENSDKILQYASGYFNLNFADKNKSEQ